MNKLILAGLSALALSAPALSRPMTATDLATMRRIAAPAVSPDGRMIAYQLRETDLAANRGRTDLYLLDIARAGAQPVRIASAPDKNEHDPRFSADGRSLYFLSDASGSDQLWRVPVAGGAPEQVTALASDIGGYMLSPAGDRLAVWADKDLRCRDFACADLPPAPPGGSGRAYNQLFVRHWDSWAQPGVRSRIFTFAMQDGKAVGAGTPVTGALVGDTPSKPFGGAEEIAWSPDGRTIYFVLREAGRIEAASTNMDIFATPADGSGAPVNLTKANLATDTLPAVSPDGRTLAYVAMRRPGNESDRQVLHLRDVATGSTRAITEGWDRSVGSVTWARDGRSLLVTAQDTLDDPAFRVDAATGKATRLTQRGAAGNVMPLPGGGFAYTLNNIELPDDLYLADVRGKSRRLTEVNRDKLRDLDRVVTRRFRFAGANGDPVWGQVTKPTNRGSDKLPVAFLVHGGPQGSFADSWSYRWNPRLFAAPGYAAVSVDFHGSTGYGQAFTDSINRDWGGKPLEDLKRGLAAAAAADASLDVANACALGGSYGGYMMNWIEGQWPDGFKCLVTHAGVFDLRAMAFETEELWFDEWDHGGPWWTRKDAERWNPVNHVASWKTPALVIHGEKDFRIPYSQSLAAFTALQRQGIDSRLLIFPDENHWILKPKNSIQWYTEVFGWLERHTRRRELDIAAN